MDNVSLRNIIHSKEKDNTTNDHSELNSPQHQYQRNAAAAASTSIDLDDTSKRKTSFATLPNTTTWQQQSVAYQQSDNNGIILINLYFNRSVYEFSLKTNFS